MKKYKVKKINKVKYLENKFGGKWRYCGQSTWECLDNDRMVWAVSSCSCDYDCGSSPRYYLYGDGTPVEVNFNDDILKLCKGNNF